MHASVMHYIKQASRVIDFFKDVHYRAALDGGLKRIQSESLGSCKHQAEIITEGEKHNVAEEATW